MHIAARPLSLLIALALVSFALGAVTTSTLSTAPATPRAVAPAFPSGNADPSLPSASTVGLPTGEPTAAPTF
ncbi:hypothetical protein [Aquabacterium humicola]|uniref:hypothetical protein n=1 Tax=Aquabacterium humicola TaxID=3237377 RepID=UPI002542DF2D|nr:hypothetical protein [Rubrivivax pictus]